LENTAERGICLNTLQTIQYRILGENFDAEEENMEETNMVEEIGAVIFNQKQIPDLIKTLGLKMKTHYIIMDNEIVQCSSCNTKITDKNLGNIMPGSKKFFCDNPACFSKYVSELEG